MTKTSKQMIEEIERLLKGSALESSISGKIYKGRFRPPKSELEDIVIIYTTADADEVQRGVMTLNIFFCDTSYYGVLVEDGTRATELETLAQEWVSSINSLGSEYYWTLQSAIHTELDDKANQHFVVVKLNFKILT